MSDPVQIDDNRMSEDVPVFHADEPMGRRDELFSVIWRRRRTIMVVMIACLAFSYVHLLRTTPMYRSSARIYVQRDAPRLVNQFEGLGITLGGANFLFTQSELIKSTPILSNVVERPHIQKLATFRDTQNPLSVLRSNLTVEVGQRDDIINISYDSPFSNDSARVVSAVVDAYSQFHAERARNTASEVLKIIRVEKDRRDRELEQKMQDMVDFRHKHGVLSFENDELNFTLRRLVTFGTALAEVELATIEAETAYLSIEEAMKDPSFVVRLAASEAVQGTLENSEFGLRLRNAQSRLIQLRRDLSDEHPAVQAAVAEVELLQRQSLAVASERKAVAIKREAQIRDLFTAQRERADELNVTAATYAMLEADVARTERILEILDTRIKELDFTDSSNTLHIAVLEPARASETPFKPQRGRLLGIGLLAGLMLGTGIALAHDKLDQCLHSTSEISRTTGLPVLGVVPMMPSRMTMAERGQQVYIEPKSDASEAYRSLRTAVSFCLNEKGLKSILVTSPSVGEGKSTMASNLAIAIAQNKQRTIIIDADFRKPALHNIFHTSGHEGLSTVLAGQSTLEESIHTTTMSRLDILPCGQLPTNPCEMLSSQAFSELIDELGLTYDRIIIDSPSVIPVADARILATVCDASLLVVQAGKSNRSQTWLAVRYLYDVGARMLGVAVNAVPPPRGRAATYYHTHAYASGVTWGGQRRRPATTNGDAPYVTLPTDDETSTTL